MQSSNSADQADLVVDIGSGGHANAKTIVTEVIAAILTIASLYTGVTNFCASFARAGLAAAQPIDTEAANLYSKMASVYLQRGLASVAITSLSGLTLYNMDPFDLGSETDTVPDDAAGDDSANPIILAFDSIYQESNPDDRLCCTLGENVWENYDCRMTSVALVVQSDGSTVLVPMPNLYRAWT
ncbi:uncharacterized protein AB675_10571 [Cyphellophora attinorum]|uniref:Uncharacterized protein n=1 Tax=Cyphellophora attinorum TaxID=1664694 RepID=A0A0N1H5H4_9EURO|nr:uncharacterized protein AB675_10571 [Phialophora attinorum]KPI40955.1 hypothetical protein AB675_10571 [Phialophora attinorum]